MQNLNRTGYKNSTSEEKNDSEDREIDGKIVLRGVIDG
jgi:hypothetical protein